MNAGAITVAVTRTGNALGLSAAEFAELPTEELQSRLVMIENDFRSTGAHFTIPTVAELPDLQQRLSH